MDTDDLVEFRSRFATCELVMLADLSTLTVLGSDSAIKTGQEYLDKICATAESVFRLAGQNQIRSAVLTKPSGRQVFVKNGDDSSEVICGLFEPTADVSAAIEHAEKMFHSSGSVTPEP